MINTLIFNHNFRYELERLIREFFPVRKFRILEGKKDKALPEDNYIYTSVENTPDKIQLCCLLKEGGEAIRDSLSLPKDTPDGELERALSVMVFELLEKHTGISPKWGILTGVRPVKLISTVIRKLGKEKGEVALRQKLLISDSRISLSEKIMDTEKQALDSLPKNSFSLYISIPFCPARCSYCSFVSHSVKEAAKYIPEYLEKLCLEISFTAETVKGLGLILDTVYIGGGTPTVLSPKELETLFKAVEKFDLSKIREFTVEAGRADTIMGEIGREKLTAIKAAGASRICINPQTLSDNVLLAVGRHHTAADVESAFYTARSLGFNNINSDLISGLPGETPESFAKSLDQLLELAPENITVHDLALKHGADLYHERESAAKFGEEMTEHSISRLSQAGYLPYYLYRQKNSGDNLENTGWTKPGFESLYNIYIMDECQTVIGLGCGASGKLVGQKNGKPFIERIRNFKYPYEYLSNFEQVLERKRQLGERLAQIKV